MLFEKCEYLIACLQQPQKGSGQALGFRTQPGFPMRVAGIRSLEQSRGCPQSYTWDAEERTLVTQSQELNLVAEGGPCSVGHSRLYQQAKHLLQEADFNVHISIY